MFNRRGVQPQADNRPICRFFKEGRCRYGADCKYRHEGTDAASNNNNNSNNQRSNNNNNNNNSNTRNGRNTASYNLDRDAIRSDLSVQHDKPGWPLSSYGPGRDAPLQLIEGAHELSPEELRVQYYLARKSGNVDQYVQDEAGATARADAAARDILKDIDGAIRYVTNGRNDPNSRLNQVTKNAGSLPTASSGGFGQTGAAAFPPGMGPQGGFNTQPSTGSGFGQPSQLGGSSQPSQSAGAKFGQPSGFGASAQQQAPPTPMSTTQPAFPSNSGTGGFGQPSQMGKQSTFGQPSQPAQQNTFGQPSQPSAFGQPSQAGQQSTFGQASQPSAFGQPSQPSAFGKPSQPSTFGQPSGQSPFGAQARTQSPFAAAAANQKPSPFGAANNPQPSTFGQPSQPGFGQPSNPAQKPSPFASTNTTQQQQQQPTGFGQPSAPAQKPSPFAAQPQHNPNPIHGKPITRDRDGIPTYLNAAGQPERVWFPDGPPPPNPDAEGPREAYEDPVLGPALRRAYEYVFAHGVFENALVPEVPPKREWVSFDL